MADPIVIEVPSPDPISVEVPEDEIICVEVGLIGPQGPPGDALLQSGIILPAVFVPPNMETTVTLPQPYVDTNYSVVTQATTVSGRLIPVNVKNKTPATFVLELCSSNLDGLESVNWTSTPHT